MTQAPALGLGGPGIAGLARVAGHASQGRESTIATARRLFADESAQGMVEYALIITFTALLCLGAIRYFGQKTNNTLTNAVNSLS
ncbi:MAG: Flp family type IVb pilin [Vulcanimicrobiaceae bacterium]|jgi:Flp pilus assembly pilin Flp